MTLETEAGARYRIPVRYPLDWPLMVLAFVSMDRRFLVMGLELRFEEDDEESIAGDGVGHGHEEDGSESFKRGFHCCGQTRGERGESQNNFCFFF